MKKLLSAIICIALVLSLVACGGGTGDTSADVSSASASSTVSSKAQSKPTSSRTVSIVKKDEPVRIMPMGDSLTQGKEHNNCGAYRPALLEMLDNDGIEYVFTGKHDWSAQNITNFQMMHSGTGGATVESLAKELPEIANRNPDIVLLMIGRNNDYHGEPLAERIYDLLVKPMLEMYPNVTVYVASIPPIRMWNGAESLNMNDKAQTDSYPAIKAMVEAHKSAGEAVEFVDMSAEATGLTWEDFNEEDHVHPLPESYAKIATQWHNAIKDKVKEISDKKNGR